MIGEREFDKKIHIDPYTYDIGDEVIAINPHIVHSDTHRDNIDYYSAQIICKEELKDLGDMIIQIIYFESDPNEPQIACWFKPSGETATRYKDIIAEAKEMVKPVSSIKRKNKINSNILKQSLNKK